MNKGALKQNFMYLTMVGFTLIVYTIGMLFFDEKWSWSIGIVFGLVFSILKLKLMQDTFTKAVLMSQEKAKSYTTRHYMLRYVLTAAVLLVAAMEPHISVMGVFVGLFSMKVAAYMQVTLSE